MRTGVGTVFRTGLKSNKLLLMMCACLCAPGAFADKSKIIVYLNDKGCPIYTRSDEGTCDTDSDERDKSCRKPGQRVWWEVSDKSFPRQIEIRWEGDDPLIAKCRPRPKATNGKITGCKIDRNTNPGDYKYTVWVADEDNCYLDPTIIVR